MVSSAMTERPQLGPQQHGSAWQAAIDFGIDVSLLEANLRLTPDERLKQLVAMQTLYDSMKPAGRDPEPPRPNERMREDER